MKMRFVNPMRLMGFQNDKMQGMGLNLLRQEKSMVPVIGTRTEAGIRMVWFAKLLVVFLGEKYVDSLR